MKVDTGVRIRHAYPVLGVAHTSLLAGFLIAAAACLTMALWLAAGRNQLQGHSRYAESHPLDDATRAELRKQASRRGPRAGLARDRLKAYQHPERVDRQLRVLTIAARSLFCCAAISTLVGLGTLVL